MAKYKVQIGIITVTSLIVLGLVLLVTFSTPNQIKPVGTENRTSSIPDNPDATPTATALLDSISNKTTPVARNSEHRVVLNDAFGEPISSATAIINEREFRITNGISEPVRDVSGVSKIVVRSPGYQTLGAEIDFDHGERHELTLEYTRTLQIAVYSDTDHAIPVEGAEVSLWKGPSVIRPVSETVDFYIRSITGDLAKIQIRRNLVDLWVHQVNFLSPQNTKMLPAGQSQFLSLGGLPFDNLVQLKYPMHSPILPDLFPSSRKLKIWDALMYYSGNVSNAKKFDDTIEYVKDGQNQMAFVFRAPVPDSLLLLKTGKTDASGRCRFDAFPPATYYVQAKSGELTSKMFILHPGRGGVDFCLSDLKEQNHANLRVRVLWKGIDQAKDRLSMRKIVGASVLLNSPDGGFFIKPTNQIGTVDFQGIKAGEYRIKVLSPKEYHIDPKTVTYQVKDENNTLTIECTGGFAISGRVIRADTEEPVKGYALMLFYYGEDHTSSKGVYDITKSGDDGTFEFRNLVPSKYILSSLNADYFNGYLPEKNPYLLPGDYSARGNEKGEIRLAIQTRDAENLIYKVLPTVETVFRGKVIDSQGNPLPKMELSVTKYTSLEGSDGVEKNNPERKPLPISKGSNQTDQDGKFQFSIISIHGEKIQNAIIFTEQTIPIKQNVRKHPNEQEQFLGKKIDLYGEKTLSFHLGDVIDDIHIVADQPKGFELFGKIMTYDEKWPIDLWIDASQDELHLSGSVDQDGNYSVTFPRTSPGTIFVSTPLSSTSDNQGNVHMLNSEYCDFKKEIQTEGTTNRIHMDIILEKATSLTGIVYDKNKQPCPMMELVAVPIHSTAKEKEQSEFTNPKGEFGFYKLKVNEQYRISVYAIRKTGRFLLQEVPVEMTDQMIPMVIGNVDADAVANQ